MDEKEVEREIKKVIDFFVKEYQAKKVILFGSRARGEHLKTSDIDLLVVAKGFEKYPNYVKRLIDVYQKLPSNYPFEIIALTPKEFEERRKLITIVKKAVETGKVLL